MDIDPKSREEIENIVKTFKCPKGFKCYKGGLENICKAKDFGAANYLICLEEHPKICPFSLPFGDGYICRCPLRVYMVKNLNK
jgi:hypothetical protein